MKNVQKKLTCIGFTIIIMTLIAGCGQNTIQDNNSDPVIATDENTQPEVHTTDDLDTPNTDNDADYIDPSVQETDTSLPRQESLEEKAKVAMETLEVWDGSIAESFDGGDGSAENPYQIANGPQLAKLAQDTNNGVDFSATYFVLTSDILLNGISQWDFTEYKYTSLDSENNWTPIGFNYSFGGTFEGGGHTIWGLYNVASYISSLYGTAAGEIGLFGTLSGGRISNVSVACGKIISSVASIGTIVGSLNSGSVNNCHALQVKIMPMSAERIGGICGYSGDSITNCSAETYIDYMRNQQELIIGGIVGRSEGYEHGSLVSGCYSKCDLSISGNITVFKDHYKYPAYIYAGGICGTGDMIDNCYSTGTIEVYSDNRTGENFEGAISVNIGGIAGRCNAYVTNCGSSNELRYTGDVESTYMGGVAGVLGRNESARDGFGQWYQADVTFCYADAVMEASGIDGAENLGGIAGCAGGEVTVKNCYYDKECSDRAIAYTVPESKAFTDQVKGLSNDELCSSTNYYNWDFDWTWTIDKTSNNGLPMLRTLFSYYKD